MDLQHVITRTEEFARQQLVGNDGSHDFHHVERVSITAIKIAVDEHKAGNYVDFLVVEMGALLHDVGDYKYSGSKSAGPDLVSKFLDTLPEVTKKQKDKIIKIMKGVSYRSSLDPATKPEMFTELAIIQDADRCDALGAIGIGRVFSYSGKAHRAMFDEDQAPRLCIDAKNYNDPNRNETAINHFFEKLLKLSASMNTRLGREIAQERHQFMVRYLRQFFNECGLEEESNWYELLKQFPV